MHSGTYALHYYYKQLCIFKIDHAKMILLFTMPIREGEINRRDVRIIEKPQRPFHST